MAKHFDICKTGTGLIRVEVSEFRGKHYLNVRSFFRTEDGSFAPTKKGVAIPIDSAREFTVKTKRLLIEAAADGIEGILPKVDKTPAKASAKKKSATGRVIDGEFRRER